MKNIVVNVARLTPLIATLFSLGACVEADLGKTTSSKNTPIDSIVVHDFSTQKKILVALKYGSEVLFEVYANNPLEEVDGQVAFNPKFKGMSLYTRTTKPDGSFSGDATLPASVSEVYIYSPTFGAPTLFKASISNGSINAVINYETAAASLRVSQKSKSARDVAANGFINKKLFPNTLGKVGYDGNPIDYIDEAGKITVDNTMNKYIDYNLPEGGTDNRYEAFVNSSDELEANDIHVGQNARLNFNFIGGTTAAQSAVGYYCYKKGDPLTKIQKAKSHACLIFANAYAPVLSQGLSVKLRYINEEGKLKSDTFPTGTMIGFMLQNNGWIGGNGTKNGVSYNVRDLFYSTKALNFDGRAHTAAIKIKDDQDKEHNIISFEDWNTGIDYNDIAFSITSDPIEAIIVKPGTDPESGKSTQRFKGVVSFEDNWPYTVDFDLNDVVIKYSTELTLNSQNQVTLSVDTFKLVWSGANESNGFAYMLNTETSNIKSITCDHSAFVGLDKSYDKAIVTLFDDAKQVLGQSGMMVGSLPSNVQEQVFIVKTEFENPVDADDLVPPYNPFINNYTGHEVHLVGYHPSGRKVQPFGVGDDASDGIKTFYVYKENNYPYALHMDARANEGVMSLAESLRGEKRITVKFAGFADWATTRNPSIIWWK